MFFRTTELPKKSSILIESSNIFYWKSTITEKKENGCGYGRKFGLN